MLSFIGFLTVCFFIFMFIKKALLNKKPSTQSIEYGIETRRLATTELNVPSSYFNYITSKHIDMIKDKAIYLKNNNPIFKDADWPRLMAASIYLLFIKDCESANFTNSHSMFNLLKIDPSVVESGLKTNSHQLIASFAQAGKDYEFSSDDEIRKLITEHAKITDNNISYSKLSKRIDRFVDDEQCSIEYFGGYRGSRFFVEINDKCYHIVTKTLNPEKEDKSSICLSVGEWKS